MLIDLNDLDSSNFDTSPVTELPEISKVRFSDLAKELKNARVQAYIEANFGIRALELLKSILSHFPII